MRAIRQLMQTAIPPAAVAGALLFSAAWLAVTPCSAQAAQQAQPAAAASEQPAAGTNPVDPVAEAERRLAAPEEGPAETPAPLPAPQEIAKQINILDLLRRGGWLMVPILAMSLLVVTFGMERMLGLRRRKVLPPRLMRGLTQLAGEKGGLDPRKAYRLCQQYPSSAARVVRAVLLKVGRSYSELERTAAETSQREATKLYANVRWLSLAAGVTPLLGLLGTVWGMIQAFFATANLPVGANKAEYLAEGIYVALVTTFAGLAVAIPAAILAHIFEGRIQSLFHELDETLFNLLPQLERFEGHFRAARQGPPAAAPATEEGPPPARTYPTGTPK